MVGHQPLVVYVCVGECICVSADMLSYCSFRTCISVHIGHVGCLCTSDISIEPPRYPPNR